MYTAIIIYPLIGSIIIGTIGRQIGIKGVRIITTTIGIISIIISILIGYEIIIGGVEIEIKISEWMRIINGENIIYYDKISTSMIILISIISTIVIYYAGWYLEEDPHIVRFKFKILFFTTSMYILVLSQNHILKFIGWEGVGLFSYLLINFWFTRIQANKSALKAILYNRIGDIGYIIMIILLLSLGEELSNMNVYNIIINNNNSISFPFFISIFSIFSILALMAKSAQIGLHPWLGDAMEGPTPVSALLHAATMVTAGVYMMLRITEQLNINKEIITIIGIITIIYGGIISSTNKDIKKIIAYSTCSQLGYMVLSISINSINNSLYHLLIHGLFKALLFLCAGIIIHIIINHDEQDYRKIGGLIHFLPFTYTLFLLGSLSITAYPFTSGFYSKDSIIELAYHWNNPFYCYILSILGGILTSFYSIKLLINIFFNLPFFSSNKSCSSISVLEDKIPNIILLLLGILGLFGGIFIGYGIKDIYIYNNLLFISDFIDLEFIPFYIKLLPILLCQLPIILYLLYYFILINNNLYFTSFISLYLYDIRYLSHYLFNFFFSKGLFIDNLFISSFVKYFSYCSSYLFILFDRGLLELFGPIGGYRFLSFANFLLENDSSNHYSNNNNNNNNNNIIKNTNFINNNALFYFNNSLFLYYPFILFLLSLSFILLSFLL